MTREEIIRNLKYTMEKHKHDTVNTFDTNISVMCKDILEYLEQEPCGNGVSRQAVDELSKELVHITRDKADFLCNFWEGLQKLPSVKPQEKTGQWIMRHRKVNTINYRTGEDVLTGEIHTVKELIRYETDEPYCACCGKRAEDISQDYCGYCGARMEVEQNG